MNGSAGSTSTQHSWSLLYQVGGAGALISAVLIPVQVLVFVVWPPPLGGPAADWFALLLDNQLVGLANLDLLLVADNVLLVPILLALYVLLRRAGESLMALTTTLGLLGVVFSIASNPAFGMLVLSNRYDAATTQAQRSATLAAGEAMLATAEGTAFHAYYVLGSVAGILIGVMMLRSTVFSGFAGWMALLGNAVALGLYVPSVGIYISVLSVLFLEVWYVLIARRLLQLGRTATGVGAPA